MMFTPPHLLCVLLLCCLSAVSSKAPDDACSINIVESIPVNMTYPASSPLHPPTFKAWMLLFGNATSHINISSFYWTLLSSDIKPSGRFPTAIQGEIIFKQLFNIASLGKVRVSVVSNGNNMPADLQQLTSAGANVDLLDVHRLLGGGILHTKTITVDSRHAYVGSANMDWRSLTEVKEIGLLLMNCPTLVGELEKVQRVYNLLSGPDSKIPSQWPNSVQTTINQSHPFSYSLNGVNSSIFISASPPQFRPPGRSDDATTIVSIIGSAKKFVYVAVMDYFPLIVTYGGNSSDSYWPNFDNALRAAAIDRSVTVRVLFSYWLHTREDMWNYLRSLQAIASNKVIIEVGYIEVPNFRSRTVPFSRVSHTKYMVTDNTAYIGTSNWSGDYFETTCGVGFVVQEEEQKQNSLRAQLEAVFMRDWNSAFTKRLQ